MDTTTANSDDHPVLFDSITAEAVQESALLTERSAGPSGMYAVSWRCLCTAFGEKYNELCSVIVAFGKRICITLQLWRHIPPATLFR